MTKVLLSGTLDDWFYPDKGYSFPEWISLKLLEPNGNNYGIFDATY